MRLALLLLSVLSGALCYLSFPPLDLAFLAFVAFVPLLVAVSRSPSLPAAAFCGAVAGLVTHVPAFAWVASVSTAGWLALALYVSLFTVVAAAGFYLLMRHFPVAWPLWASMLWVALELTRAELGPGFPWLFLGYTQYRAHSVLQVASLGGVYAVSFLVFLPGAALLSAVQSFWRRHRPLQALALAIFAVVLPFSAAAWGRAEAAALDVAEGPAVGVVQHNVPRLVDAIFSADKSDEQVFEEIRAELRKAVELSRRVKGTGVRLVVWPETTVQIAMNIDPSLFADASVRDLATEAVVHLRTLGHTLDSYLLIGAPTRFARTEGYVRAVLYGPHVDGFGNSAVLFDPRGQFVERYDKVRLVPFGEYIPLRDALPFLQWFTPLTREVIRGTAEIVFEVPFRNGDDVLRVAPLICYEDVFPDLTATFRRMGADVLVNLTDEGWYTIPGELGQHLAMAVFRAVETRTTVVRAANTGISCFIGPTGEIYAQLEPHTAAVLSAPLRLTDYFTPYVCQGDAFAVSCLMLVIAVPVIMSVLGRDLSVEP